MNVTSSISTRPAGSGRGTASGRSVISGDSSSISNTRWAAAEARCHWMRTNPTIRNGAAISSTYALNATMSPTATLPSMASRPPVSSTKARPNRGSASMIGAWRARASAVAVPAQRSRRAERASSSTWACSWAKVRTTWAPWMFSSTIMATSAMRAWVTQLRGKTLSRSRTPTYSTSGSGAMATRVRGSDSTSIAANPMASSASCMATRGPKAKSSWIERMSLLAREMTCPVWVLSQYENDSSVRRSYTRLRRSASML